MRRIALDVARDATVAQWRAVADAVLALPDEVFAAPTRLGDWTVTELVAHLDAVAVAMVRSLTGPVADSPVRTLPDYFGVSGSGAAAVDARARELGAAPGELRPRVAADVAAATDELTGIDAERMVTVFGAPMALTDFLVTRCVEGVVHGLDLAAAAGSQVPLDQAALRLTVRALADQLAVRAPGRSVEVRIPGPAGAAVQCVEGPRHTRGTPPNVVECDPVTFAELATGRLAWADGVAAGRVKASGGRADLSPYLPVLR